MSAASFALQAYTPGLAERWDRFVTASWNGTLLHTRRFLSYHRDRFEDHSLVVTDTTADRIVGVFPAARDPRDPAVVASHPGATYGGLVRDARLSGEGAVALFSMLRDTYRARGFERLRYRAIPRVFQRKTAEDDLYALFRLGARRDRCDLGAVVDLGPEGLERPRIRAETSLRARTELARGNTLLPAYWPVLEASLAARHAAKPVHTLDEIRHLADLFPTQIECICQTDRATGEVLAGVVVFKVIEQTWHTQYIGASAHGHEIDATKLLFVELVKLAFAEGATALSFGISTEQGGAVLNTGLFTFKSRLGGGGMVHESYELDL